MDTPPIPWTDVVSSVASGITATGVVVGGWWAYKRFVREAPHWTRADARVSASLLTTGTHDVLRTDLEVRAIGHARITFKRDDEKEPVVTVYRFTTEMLETGEPAEWTDVLYAQRVLADQRLVEAGETVSESYLLPMGERADDTLAYRVRFIFTAHDELLKQDFSWQAVDYVPVRMSTVESGGTAETTQEQQQQQPQQ